MEDPVRKVGGGGGPAGGDRWEGEDEDEDVKVGAGRDGRAPGPGALPGPVGRGTGRERRAGCPLLRSLAARAGDGRPGLPDLPRQGGGGTGPGFRCGPASQPGCPPPAGGGGDSSGRAGPCADLAVCGCSPGRDRKVGAWAAGLCHVGSLASPSEFSSSGLPGPFVVLFEQLDE